ncbi:DinB family protein [Amycolatopsis nigrescens]|uniref:DinB family protein n=1 Tax=Amycolatopsis nigrescens TaxID=381445 RepID=UPI00038213F8|nr:DinB family protein [Amycolatopsis nigrescens]
MIGSGPKADLHRYLQEARDALLWKLDGLSEYDVRRPLTPTGTNLLGLVKHLTGVEIGYFGETFGRPVEQLPPWLVDLESAESADPTVDMWATAEESREEIIGYYRRACAHSDATIDGLALDAAGRVEPWPEHLRAVTLHRILVHVLAETHRHAGHADIVRELVDGAAGMVAGNENLPEVDRRWWAEHRDRLERVARAAATGQ